MFFFLIFIIFILAAYVILTLFIPQKLPWYRPHLILSKSEMTEMPPMPTVVKQPLILEGLAEPEDELRMSAKDQVARLESILLDKNRTIERLQRELLVEKEGRSGLETLKVILEKEIENLKIKNKRLKERIGE